MTLENDTLHVVIRLPFKRPPGFIEPPPIVWTDEMEQRLWQYISQKQTDWNYIADQLGVPSSYLVRHAAFIYETQLRGIHQQLRLSEVGRSSTSPAPKRSLSSHSRSSSTVPSRKQTPTSRGYPSNSLQNEEKDDSVGKGPLKKQSPTASQSLTSASGTPVARSRVDITQSNRHDDSMMLSTISNIAPRTFAETNSSQSISISRWSTPTSVSKTPDLSSVQGSANAANETIYKSFQSQASRTYYSPAQSLSQIMGQRSSSVNSNKSSTHNTEISISGQRGLKDVRTSSLSSRDFEQRSPVRYDEEEEGEGETSMQRFSQMQIEEPAFLPSRRKSQSALLPRQERADIPLPKILMQTHDNDAEDSRAQSFQSSQSTLKSTTLNKGKSRLTSASMYSWSNNYNTRVAATTNISDDSSRSTGSAFNSIGSSTSNLSDASVTQSALEDAFLSNFNNGSKMSSMAFSRRYGADHI